MVAILAAIVMAASVLVVRERLRGSSRRSIVPGP
jgi:hypothetical protein